MRWWIVAILSLVGIKSQEIVSPRVAERPLDKYTIENLGKREYISQIFIDDEISPGVFTFHFDSDGKKVTGLAHIPKGCKKCPVIAQFHGYVNSKTYKPGEETAHSAEYYTANGFISLAPDFLGLGGSDMPSADVFEERFQTYTAALNLLAAIKIWDRSNGHIGVWGHSNGGQIALTIMEISKLNYPTVLWAPVSQSFPYSILYFSDETDDHGKLLRRELAKFEQYYDTDLYSLINYLNHLQAPLQIHQGTADQFVPKKWNDALVSQIKKVNPNLEVNYFIYQGADHNLTPGWNSVVNRDIEFFQKDW